MLDFNNNVATSVSWPQLHYVKPGLKPGKNAGKKYFPNRFLHEHKKRQLSRAFVDVAWLCSCVEPQKEREKLSLDQVFVWVSDLAWACDPINNQSLVSGQLKKKTADLDMV